MYVTIVSGLNLAKELEALIIYYYICPYEKKLPN